MAGGYCAGERAGKSDGAVVYPVVSRVRRPRSDIFATLPITAGNGDIGSKLDKVCMKPLSNKGIAHFVAFGFAFLFFIQLVLIIGPLRRLGERRCDFRDLYSSGYMVRTGHGKEIYDLVEAKKFQDQLVGQIPETFFFDHPAFETLFFVPLSLLRFDVAYWLMFLLN